MARDEAKRKITNEQLKEKVGKIYGCYKVLEFLGEKSSGKAQYKFLYKVQCTNCGSVRTLTWDVLRGKNNLKRTRCKKCFRVGICTCPEEARNWSVEKRTKAIENTRQNGRANSNNVSSGIKHYYIQQLRGNRYIHSIRCQIDGVVYTIRCKSTNDVKDVESTVLAQELNRVIKEGGKEAFKEWYKENSKKFSNTC